jgi:hypothetical protein
MTSVAVNNAPCAICGYPIPEPSYVGQQVKCAYCGSINEAIAQVSTPTTILVGVACFVFGVLLGPALLISAKAGQESLERKAKTRFTR